MPSGESTRVEALARVMRHPLRQRLLFEYADAARSPSAVAAALGVRLNLVSYHTQVLLREGCLELVRTRRRRGAVEHFYRSRTLSEIDDDAWERLPRSLRRVLVRATIDITRRETSDAIPRGGMDAPSAHVSRSYLVLDRQGRDELAQLLEATLESAGDIERRSRGRGGDQAPWELVIMSFGRSGP
jgi:hypothetical protein